MYILRILLLSSFARRVSAYTWACSLENSPLIEVPIPMPASHNENDVRNLRRIIGVNSVAIAMHSGYIERQMREEDEPDYREVAGQIFGLHSVDNNVFDRPKADDINNNTTINARKCECANDLSPGSDEGYYCPMPTDTCEVYSRRYGDDHGVNCFISKDWKIGFSRNVWYYLCFALVLLAFYPIFTRPGHVSIFVCMQVLSKGFACISYTDALIIHQSSCIAYYTISYIKVLTQDEPMDCRAFTSS